MRSLFIVFLLIFSTGCREEILDPYNPAGNINQPYQELNLNYLNLVLTADRFSQEFDLNVNFNTSDVRILISVLDRKEGNIQVNVLNENKYLIFTASIETELANLVERIIGNVPTSVKIKCSDFTGKFRLQMSKTNW